MLTLVFTFLPDQLTQLPELRLHAVTEHVENSLLQLHSLSGQTTSPSEVWLRETREILHHVLLGLVGHQQAALVLQTLGDQVELVRVLLLLCVTQSLGQHSVLTDEKFAVAPGLPHGLQFIVSHVLVLKHKDPAGSSQLLTLD